MSPERALLLGHLADARSTEARLEAEISSHAFTVRQRIDKYAPIVEWNIEQIAASTAMMVEAHGKLVKVKKQIKDLESDLGQ